MKKMYKAMLLVLCAVLLVVASVMGTLAYLQMTTGTVQNTFTVGKVEITLDEAKVNAYGELVDVNGNVTTAGADNLAPRIPDGNSTGNEYKLIPGHEYTKDPTVTVKAGSEACYVFVKVTNNISAIEAATTIFDQIEDNDWNVLYTFGENYTTAIYYMLVDATDVDVKYPVFNTFKIKTDADGQTLKNYDGETIEITAYAIQMDGLVDPEMTEWENADAAWTKGSWYVDPV